MKILFLYTELSEYFLSCVNVLSQKSNSEIHIVRWSVNKEAPFNFSFPDNVKIYERNNFDKYSLIELVSKIIPDIIYCSGWLDKEYLSVCKSFRNKIPVVVGFDNHWKGSLKQQLGSLFSKITIQNYFSHCWIPGKPQEEFARRLGFDKSNTLYGFYSCDYNLFHNYYLKYKEQKRKNFPHRFIFSGRYVHSKGINNLWQAFIDLQKENPNDWELYCLGTGDIKQVIHPKIKHFGFVQPKAMEKYIADTGVFVLPSTFEPWGVVLHEFAAAGFPLICSNEVGAAEKFLQENENGFMFKAGNISALKEAMRKIISLSDEKLIKMGEKSAELAKQITPDIWADTLMSILKTHHA